MRVYDGLERLSFFTLLLQTPLSGHLFLFLLIIVLPHVTSFEILSVNSNSINLVEDFKKGFVALLLSKLSYSCVLDSGFGLRAEQVYFLLELS